MNQGNNPVQAARDLLSDVGWERPGDLSLEEIAGSLGAVIERDVLGGSEGRILMMGNSAIIKLNVAIEHPGKRNFVTAHEIGHFVLHKELKLFVDNNRTLSEWYAKGAHEQEANKFAEELLMPRDLFKQKVQRQKLSISLISDVAGYFSVSLTAAFIRYSRIGEFPMMIIYIEDGIVKWKTESGDFPFPYLQFGSKVSAWTVAGDFFNGKYLEQSPVKVDAIEWFPNDYKLEHQNDWKLWEQCFQVSQNGLMTCLWSL